MVISVSWGPRSSTKRDSFWLKPPVLVGNPVRVRAFDGPPGLDWLDAAKGTQLAVTTLPNTAEAKFDLPNPLPKFVVLDFDLQLEVDSVRGTGLRLRQQCSVDGNGTLLPSKFVRREVKATFVPFGGVLLADKAPAELVGTHPLLRITTAGIQLDAEFLDVTELWWGLRAKHRTAADVTPGDWYLHPALGGNPDRLRVLAATTPGLGPMIWMAWASRAAAVDAKKVQPLVYMIAQAWLNGSALAFSHRLDSSGFVTAAKSGAPMEVVGRFLLSSVPSTRLDAVRKAPPRLPEDQLWRLATDVLPATVPNMLKGALWPEKLWGSGKDADRAALPMGTTMGHRPAGHEAAADGSGKPLLLLYPISPSISAPFATVIQAGLAQRMTSLVGTMFGLGGVAAAATVAPTTDELILAGHSSGNVYLWIALEANGADIVKCITFDAANEAVPEAKVDKIQTGVNGRKGKAFTLILVTTQNSFGSIEGLKARVTKVQDAMKANKAAKLVLLPALADQAEFWDPKKIRPTAAPTKNPLLRSMLAAWPDSEVTKAAAHPGDWNFLFFHEFAAYGGQSLTRTFFREALDL